MLTADRIRLPFGWKVAVGLIAIGLVAITLIGLGRPFGNGDEVIYAENVREMAQGGDYLSLTWQGSHVYQRPSTPFVMVFAVSRLVGGELGLRLLSGLFSLGTLGLLFSLAYRRGRRPDAGLVAALLCAGAPSFHLYSRSLLSDPSLCFALTVALAGTLWAQRDPRGLVLAAAGLGAGVAFKSLAAAIPGLALAPGLFWAARKHRRLKTIGVAVAVFFALAAPFFVVGVIRHGDEFLRWHLGRSLLERARGHMAVARGTGPLFYLRVLWQTDGPAVFLWVVGGAAAALALGLRKRDSRLAIAGSYALIFLAGISLVGTRLAHYLLPLYPGAALAAAGAYERATRSVPDLYRSLAIAASAALLLVGVARSPDQNFLPSPSAHQLGLAAQKRDLPGDRVYTLDWYAPALGYYAERDWHLLSTDPAVTEFLGSHDMLKRAGVVHPVPPWPAGTFLLASSRADLSRAPLDVIEVIAEHGDDLLVRARANSR